MTLEAPSISDLVSKWARLTPEAPAILDVDGSALTYAALKAAMDEIKSTMAAWGITPGDRVALSVPNGWSAALLFLGVATAACCGPLNPLYREEELEFYLTDMGARLVIVPSGAPSAAAKVAEAMGLGIATVEFDEIAPQQTSKPNSPLRLSLQKAPARAQTGAAALRPEVALVLHTSGTTARPKLVPLLHKNLLISAGNISLQLDLSEADRCLNVMPLFHVHGLVASLLSTLCSGGSIICCREFEPTSFLDCIERHRPTWYSAVPTIHHAVATHAAKAAHVSHSLRFIRSCSAALPPSLMARVESIFNVPLVEAYGMTEAAHQMTSNLLPPLARKPGSVGVQTGPDVSIINEQGEHLSTGETGEIVIKGANVMDGYEQPPGVNATAFSGGWFRTGDYGYLDDEGYLFIKGRIKEQINRGGEKIAPKEIDEVLLRHEKVDQALAFALPHATLGEDVAAAIVLKQGMTATLQELSEFAAQHLAQFKVPRRIVFLEDLPKGPTGKPQRVGLAARLNLTHEHSAEERQSPAGADHSSMDQAPVSELEKSIAAIWCEVLERSSVGLDDSFLELEGDSIRATQIMSRISSRQGVEIDVLAIFQYPTVRTLAEHVTLCLSGSAKPLPPLTEPASVLAV